MKSNRLNYLIIRKENCKGDWKLSQKDSIRNNGRKVFVNEIYPESECIAEHEEWKPSASPLEKTPVMPTGKGGFEICTFNQNADQDCHKHIKGTEIYSVLEGEMSIRLNEKEIVTVQVGDDIVVLPGTAHEVLNSESSVYLTRVYSIDCFGDDDKFVKDGQEWVAYKSKKQLMKDED